MNSGPDLSDWRALLLSAANAALEEVRSRPELASGLRQVVISVEDDAPLDDPDLLGLYEGHPLTERYDDNGMLPSTVRLFLRPLLELSTYEGELLPDVALLREEVRVTVLHELGHHFGIEDERLDELGWA